MMNARSIPMAIVMMMLIIIAVPSAEAGKAFLDDFEDGSATDGKPVSWAFVAPWDNANFGVTNGSLVVTPGGQGISGEADLEVSGQIYAGDVSLRSQVFAPAAHSVMLITRNSRVGEGTAQIFQLFAGIQGEGNIGIAYYNGASTSSLRMINPGWNPFNRNVNLQFDVLGETASLKAWPEDLPEPIAPQVVVNISRIRAFNGNPVTEGTVGALIYAGGAVGTAEYRFFEVVPEPSSALLAALGLLGLLLSNRRVTK